MFGTFSAWDFKEEYVVNSLNTKIYIYKSPVHSQHHLLVREHLCENVLQRRSLRTEISEQEMTGLPWI